MENLGSSIVEIGHPTKYVVPLFGNSFKVHSMNQKAASILCSSKTLRSLIGWSWNIWDSSL
jgi:hypothetical protein